MNEQEYNKKVDLLWYSEIILEELIDQKKIDKKKKTEIENKLRKLSYEIWLNSPKIKNDSLKQKEIALRCIQDFVNHNQPN